MRDFCITKATAATPSDTVDESKPGIGILLNVSGVIKVDVRDPSTGSVSTISPSLVGGVWHPMQVSRVYSTGTDAAVLAADIYLGW